MDRCIQQQFLTFSVKVHPTLESIAEAFNDQNKSIRKLSNVVTSMEHKIDIVNNRASAFELQSNELQRENRELRAKSDAQEKTICKLQQSISDMAKNHARGDALINLIKNGIKTPENEKKRSHSLIDDVPVGNNISNLSDLILVCTTITLFFL